jgi:hypothetical protein
MMHVVAHGVHRDTHGKDGVMHRVAQVVDEPLPAVLRVVEELEHECLVEDEAQQGRTRSSSARTTARYAVTSWPVHFSTWCIVRHLWRSISRRRRWPW